MKRKFLADSYDAVKRLWQDLLQGWAPLYAEPRFIPKDLRDDFTLLTRIPILPKNLPDRFSILNDPDTGIRLPGNSNQAEGRTHISVLSIAKQLQDSRVKCVVTFDQSDYRNSGMKRKEQRLVKMQALAGVGINSFYYVSHAPFLFAVSDTQSIQELQLILIAGGIPEDRFEAND